MDAGQVLPASVDELGELDREDLVTGSATEMRSAAHCLTVAQGFRQYFATIATSACMAPTAHALPP